MYYVDVSEKIHFTDLLVFCLIPKAFVAIIENTNKMVKYFKNDKCSGSVNLQLEEEV